MASTALDRAQENTERLSARIARIRAEHQNGIRETVGAGVTIATSFAIAWFQERYPNSANIVGVPVSLFAGGALLALAAFEVGGKESVYLSDAGRGALAAWAAGQGGAIGREQLAHAPR